jgi:hypothetical protein
MGIVGVSACCIQSWSQRGTLVNFLARMHLFEYLPFVPGNGKRDPFLRNRKEFE